MEQAISVIGGADGPTSVFVAVKTGFSWLNIFGLIFVVLLLIPSIIFASKSKKQPEKCDNKLMLILEQLGRYGCMLLMIFNIGILEYGFKSPWGLTMYIYGGGFLMLAYWFVWILYRYKKSWGKELLLAVIPACLFLLCGLTIRHYLLAVFAVIFAIGHVYVSKCNRTGRSTVK